MEGPSPLQSCLSEQWVQVVYESRWTPGLVAHAFNSSAQEVRHRDICEFQDSQSRIAVSCLRQNNNYKKKAGRTSCGEQTITTFLHGLCFSSGLQVPCIPALICLHHRLETINWNKPFLLNLVLVTVIMFIIAIGSKQK